MAPVGIAKASARHIVSVHRMCMREQTFLRLRETEFVFFTQH